MRPLGRGDSQSILRMANKAVTIDEWQVASAYAPPDAREGADRRYQLNDRTPADAFGA